MLDNIANTIKFLHECGVLNLIAICLSPIISFFVLFLTLSHNSTQFKIQIKNQEKEHQENIALLKRQHKQSLVKQD